MSTMRVDEIFDMIETHCLRVNYFDRVNRHEPKNAPGRGLTAAIWVERLDPVTRSGLDATSVRLEFMVRIYSNMLQEPQDYIDPEVLRATDALMEAYTGDFELGGEANYVDLLGTHGAALSGQSGYLSMDHKMYRCMTIRVPCIIDNIWNQDA